MTAREVWAGDAHYTVNNESNQLQVSLQPVGDDPSTDDDALSWLLRCAVLCNNGIPPHEYRHRSGVADPIDEALLIFALECGVDPDQVRHEWPRIREFPFDASRRRMSTLNQREDEHILFVKGGPVETLAGSSHELRNGKVEQLSPARQTELLERVNAMTDRGLRVLAFAYREVSESDHLDSADQAEQDLIFVGVIGLENPVRPEVPAAVARCYSAGIRVVMLTGDYGHTALEIARQVGIATGSEEVVTGTQLDTLDDEALATFLAEAQPTVFAHMTPEHKLRLVQVFKRLGHIVAVTGDGVNDAPALRAADIGVAMGRTGTDVAREAADMVLMDDNFATIVRAVEEGRAIYENIKKFLTYVLTSNVAETVPFVLFILAGVPPATYCAPDIDGGSGNGYASGHCFRRRSSRARYNTTPSTSASGAYNRSSASLAGTGISGVTCGAFLFGRLLLYTVGLHGERLPGADRRRPAVPASYDNDPGGYCGLPGC